MEIDLDNIEFQYANDLIRETNHSFFLTGKAGTGKSTFLKNIVETIPKNFIVVAPTGIAAVNIGGMTIHSVFQFPLRPLLQEDEGIKIFGEKSEKRKLLSAMDTLIIDEISMVRADLIDGIDYSLRKNGGNPNLPFGGKQVIFVGDVFQLEPVTIKSTGEQKIINEIYKSPYFYHAKVFYKLKLFTVELQKVYRQNDPHFIELLDKVRVKEVTTADINKLNTRVFSETELKGKEFAITLTTKNDLADRVNSNKLAQLKTIPFKYVAETTGEFEESKYPTDPELLLKEGAQVIFIKNDSEKRWVNGSIGQVCELNDSYIKIKLNDDSVHSIEKREWENIRYQYNPELKKIEQEIVGVFKQYPIRLAWAITIHKSQGLTFDKIVVDFGNGTFASGQAYVALSRATSFQGLYLKQKIQITDIYIAEEIKNFAKSFNNKEAIHENLSAGRTLYRYQKNNDIERIGDFYFNKAITSLKNNDFKSAYHELVLGFENISCDCVLSTLLEKDEELIVQSFKTGSINCTIIELDFIRAVFYYFLDSGNFGKNPNGVCTKALPFINSYLEENINSEIGHYLKGRILSGLGNFEDAILEMEIALSIKVTSRTHYRIGRIKEEKIDHFGVDHLLKSVLLNLSSLCANRWFKDIADKREIKLISQTNKLLANKFNNSDTVDYCKTINQFLKQGNVELTNDTILPASIAFTDFFKSLKADESLFKYQIIDNDDDFYYDYDENYHLSSYEKYGGYNGYDDNTIDDAFEGDPSNTWNVD